MGTNAFPICSPHSPPDAAVNRVKRLGPKNQVVKMSQATVAKTHWSNLRVRLTEEVRRRGRNTAVVQAQDHFINITLRRLRLDARMCVVARGCG